MKGLAVGLLLAWGFSAQAAPDVSSADLDAAKALLSAKTLAFPLPGYKGRLLDNFDERRGSHVHEAIDIMAPRGTPVVAVDDGTIAKLFDSKAGGLTIYQFDPSGRLAYYYAHLDRYAPGLEANDAVKRGQVIGFVGSTGNAKPDAPHLHFTVFALGPKREWWKGVALNPYVPLAAALVAR